MIAVLSLMMLLRHLNESKVGGVVGREEEPAPLGGVLGVEGQQPRLLSLLGHQQVRPEYFHARRKKKRAVKQVI